MQDGDKAPTSPSYCHPWASGVTHWLSGAMAGIVALEPGYSRFVVLPHTSQSYPHVSATQGTPHGPITVSAVRDTARRTVAIEVESSVPGLVGLRLADEALPTSCTLNLSTVKLTRGRSLASESPELIGAADTAIDLLHPVLHSAHIFVEVAAGRSVVTAAFNTNCAETILTETKPWSADGTERYVEAGEAGLPTIPPFAPPSYPGRWTMDATTGGDWQGKYGQDGYRLFGYDPEGADVSKLPSWVYGVYGGKKANNEAGIKSRHIGTDPSNKAFLTNPHNPKLHARSLGWASNSGNYFGADGSQGTVININVTQGTKYNLSVYVVSGVNSSATAPGTPTKCPNVGMVDSPCTSTKQAIRVMDLETLNPIAPEPQLIDASGTGLYWTLTYDRGVRLRIMPIDGDSGCAAVFFDKA
jgi:hypothetical protein